MKLNYKDVHKLIHEVLNMLIVVSDSMEHNNIKIIDGKTYLLVNNKVNEYELVLNSIKELKSILE